MWVQLYVQVLKTDMRNKLNKQIKFRLSDRDKTLISLAAKEFNSSESELIRYSVLNLASNKLMDKYNISKSELYYSLENGIDIKKVKKKLQKRETDSPFSYDDKLLLK